MGFEQMSIGVIFKKLQVIVYKCNPVLGYPMQVMKLKVMWDVKYKKIITNSYITIETFS